MARLPRLYAPNIPQLVQAQFAHPLAPVSDPTPLAQLDQLLAWLKQDARENRIALHGWLLLNDRITLLATPPDAKSMARLIQALGRRMAAGMRHGRVFTGRYRSALVEPKNWLLPALIWLETLPVALHYVDRAQNWPWSSAASHTGQNPDHDALVTDHQAYWEIGNTPFARQARYAERLNHGLAASENQKIEAALFGQWVLGDPEFLDRLQTHATRRLAPAAKGRPRKALEKPAEKLQRSAP